MLEGSKVNLRASEPRDIDFFVKWVNNPEYGGEFEPLEQKSPEELEKELSNLPANTRVFIIEKKDNSRIGHVIHFLVGDLMTIGYNIIPTERNNGYCTEAVKLLVDFLFLSKDFVRIQAFVNPKNIPSQRVVEKSGFTKEGVMRKSTFIRGEWRDGVIYSILREEWKEPRIVMK